MCQPAIPLGEDQGLLKQENRMKTLSKWLMATALTVISFFIIMMLITGIFEPSSAGIFPVCWGMACS